MLSYRLLGRKLVFTVYNVNVGKVSVISFGINNAVRITRPQ